MVKRSLLAVVLTLTAFANRDGGQDVATKLGADVDKAPCGELDCKSWKKCKGKGNVTGCGTNRSCPIGECVAKSSSCCCRSAPAESVTVPPFAASASGN